MKFHTMMFLTLLLSTSILAISSSSWIQMWLWMEINLYTFLIILSKNNSANQASNMLYFLVQAISSVGVLSSLIFTDSSFITSQTQTMILTMAILIKLGASPFHQWIVMITPNFNFHLISMMLTIQKIIPTFITPSIFMNKLLLASSLMSALISAFLCNKSSNTKTIMSMSSINNMGWLTMIMMLSSSLSFSFLTFYSISTLLLIKTMSLSNQISISTMSTNFSMNSMNLFSMIGIPPLLGFFPKLWIMGKSTEMLMSINILILIISTCFMAMAYLSIMLPSLLSPIKTNTMNTFNIWSSINLLPIIFLPMMN